MRFQLRATKTGYDLLDGRGLVPYLTGTCTTAGVNQLINTGAAFATPPVVVSSYAVNVDTGQNALINSIAGATALNIAADIFTVTEVGDAYGLVDLRNIIGSTFPDGVSSVAFSLETGANAFQIYDAYPNTTNRFVVEVDITDYAGGELVVQHGDGVASFESLDAAYTATSNGTHSFYGIATVGTRLRILDASEEANYTITGIRIYYVSVAEVYVYEDGVEIDQINPTQYIHDRALFTVDILSYGIGCYTLYANSVNGLVGSSTFPLQVNPPWLLNNIGPGWAFTAGELVHTVDGPVESDEARYNLQANADINCNYVIYFRLATGSDKPVVYIDLPSTGPLIVSTYFGSVLGDEYYINIYGYNFNDIRFVASETDSVTIEEFNLYKTFYNEPGGYFSPDLTEYVAAFRIAPNFCTIAADVCVKELGKNYVLYESSITNGEFTPVKKKNRWLPASESYTERCFVQSNVRYARTQDDDFESYRDSDGFGRVVFSDPVRVNECQIAPAPEWVHNWMAWAIRNTFKVNGEEYYPLDGNYSPNWQRDTPNASAVFEIAQQNQNIKTTGCD